MKYNNLFTFAMHDREVQKSFEHVSTCFAKLYRSSRKAVILVIVVSKSDCIVSITSLVQVVVFITADAAIDSTSDAIDVHELTSRSVFVKLSSMVPNC